MKFPLSITGCVLICSVYVDEEELGGHVIFLKYKTTFPSVNEEYLLYNFGSITAAVGGAVGLFVGVSLFNCFDFIIRACYEKQKKKRMSAVKVMKVAPPTNENLHI